MWVLEKVECGRVEWIQLAQKKGLVAGSLNMILDLQDRRNAGNFINFRVKYYLLSSSHFIIHTELLLAAEEVYKILKISHFDR
jgi:hypothetical protein